MMGVCTAVISPQLTAEQINKTDTWIISGQSNACGGGELPGAAPDAGVRMWYNNQWVPAKEPLFLGGTHWGSIQKKGPAAPLDGGVGPWLTCATAVAKEGLSVRLCGYALGGAPISHWDEHQTGWKNLNACITECGEGAGGFLWYQGESDGIANMAGNTYQQKLKALIAKVRTTAKNPKMLVVIVQIARQGSFSGNFSMIREAERQYVLSDPDSILVPALGREGSIHLTKAGYFELGHEIARALLKTRYHRPNVNWPGPILDGAFLSQNDSKTVCAHFAEVKTLGGTAAEDFSAEDAGGLVQCIRADAQNTRITLTLERALKGPAKLRYAYGKNPKAGLVDEAGNRAPAVQLDITAGMVPADRETKAPNGAGGDFSSKITAQTTSAGSN